MPASRKARTFYLSDNAKEKLLSLDPDASFSVMINRAIREYYLNHSTSAHRKIKEWNKEMDSSLTRRAQKEKEREIYNRLMNEE